jgi:hypothetical protein
MPGLRSFGVPARSLQVFELAVVPGELIQQGVEMAVSGKAVKDMSVALSLQSAVQWNGLSAQ